MVCMYRCDFRDGFSAKKYRLAHLFFSFAGILDFDLGFASFLYELILYVMGLLTHKFFICTLFQSRIVLSIVAALIRLM